MRNLVITRADDNIKTLTELSFPIIKDFAKRWGAEFKVLDHDSSPKNFYPMTDDNLPHFRIMAVYDLYKWYDRILVMDCDMVINKTCPNPFEVVDPEKIGTIYEDKGSRLEFRRQVIKDVQKQFGDIGWEKDYINTGFFLTSKKHKNIFQPIDDGKFWTGWGSDDVNIGYLIKLLGHEVQELSFMWNHMSMFSEAWNGNANRLNSYIIHYAGVALNKRCSIMKHDIKQIYGG